jgi:hypothetical protein
MRGRKEQETGERCMRRSCVILYIFIYLFKYVYRVIKKSLCTWSLRYRKLQEMFKVSPASLQTFIDARLTLAPSVIHNSNYVMMVSDWNCLKYFCMFFVL